MSELDGEVTEMTTSANIATVPSPFIITTKTPWPFGGVTPVPVEKVRKKSRRKRRMFLGPYINVADLSM